MKYGHAGAAMSKNFGKRDDITKNMSNFAPMNAQPSDFEIMAPVGSRESLAAAINAGADSVYFGIGQLNMRSHSANHFTIDDLREIASICSEHGIKTYLTVNTIIYGSYISLNTMTGFGYYFYNGKYFQVWGPSKNVNPDLRWEKGKNWNIGIDFSLFNNRVYGSVNYFNRKQQDLLGNYKVSVPPYLFDETFVNVGTMKNTGIEIDVNFKAVNTKDFSYDLNFVGTTMKNKFVDFSNSKYIGQDYYDMAGTEDPYPFYNLQRIQKGESLGNFYMWRYAGHSADGEWLVYDKDGDIIRASQASDADRQVVGNGMPKFTMSSSHNFRYKNFDLSLFFRGAFGYDIFNIHDFYYGTRNFTGNRLDKAYGKNFVVSGSANPVVCDYFLEKGDYLKLDMMTLGYTLNLKDCPYLDRVRVYGTMKNIFTITKFSGVDPSSYQVNGLTPGAQGSRTYFPTTRQFIVGLQIDF